MTSILTNINKIHFFLWDNNKGKNRSYFTTTQISLDKMFKSLNFLFLQILLYKK